MPVTVPETKTKQRDLAREEVIQAAILWAETQEEDGPSADNLLMAVLNLKEIEHVS